MTAAESGGSGPVPRSWLYVPADRPERLARVFERGADAVIVDLEDSVPADRKLAARAGVREWLADVPRPVWVRVNGGDLGLAEIEALADRASVAGFCLAKASVASVQAAADRLDGLGSAASLAPLIEDAQALLDARAIAALPRVTRLQLGEADLRAELGLTPSAGEPELLTYRAHLVLASRAAGLAAPPAPVSPNFSDVEALTASTRALARMGFFGRACIHPAQVAVVNAVFEVSSAELAHAQTVLAALAAAGGGAAHDGEGQMIDEAMARAARAVIARAAAQR